MPGASLTSDLDIHLEIVRWDFIGSLLEARTLSGNLWHCSFILVLGDVCALDELGKPRHFVCQRA